MTDHDRMPRLSPRDLDVLGLAGWVVEAEFELYDPRPGDRGLGLAPPALDLTAGLAAAFDRLEGELGTEAADRLDRLSYSVLRHRVEPSLHLIVTPAPPRLLDPASARCAVVRDHELLVDIATLSGRVVCAVGDVHRLVLTATGDRRVGVALLLPAIDLDPPPTVSSGVRSWVDSSDAWLRGEIERRLADPVANAFDEAAAIGALLRLRPLEPASSLEALLRGEVGADADRERAWARSLSRAQLDGIEDLALGEVAVVGDELRDLLDGQDGDAGFEEEPWSEHLTALLRRRDVLEGVATLLDAAGAGVRLAGSLERLDGWAGPVVEALALRDLPDEHLRRASRIEPEAWWLGPARASRDA